MKLEVIGYFHSHKKNPYEAARQPAADESQSEGYIELLSGKNFEQALIELQTFSHLWIIYQFHHNQHWKPMVLPPRGIDHKVGVFATRAPYRPNPIGMSAVRIEKIEGLKIHILGHDILDQSPVFDIKPYLKYSDSIPDATEGWLKLQEYRIEFTPAVLSQLAELEKLGVVELRAFILQQLKYEPTDEKRKRVQPENGPRAQANSGEFNNQYILAYRTWRVHFEIEKQDIVITGISSGYSESELRDRTADSDKYQDKHIHRQLFLK